MFAFQILDKAERLRDMEANILPAFLRLQELVRICNDLSGGLDTLGKDSSDRNVFLIFLYLWYKKMIY